jgi:hypothetical protein
MGKLHHEYKLVEHTYIEFGKHCITNNHILAKTHAILKTSGGMAIDRSDQIWPFSNASQSPLLGAELCCLNADVRPALQQKYFQSVAFPLLLALHAYQTFE